MPHIVFNKRINLNDFQNEFFPIFQKEPVLIKVQTIFVDKDNLTALLPSIVISELHQEFLIEISTRQEKTTIRLYPGTDPEKTDGVKTAMALLAKQIMKLHPNFEVTKTNLSDYLNLVIEN